MSASAVDIQRDSVDLCVIQLYSDMHLMKVRSDNKSEHFN